MKKIFYIILLVLILLSCSKKEYVFIVQNKTNYTLNEVNVAWCNDDNIIILGPNDTKEVLLTYKASLFKSAFGPGELCVTVLTYSDTTGTYTNTRGSAIGRNNLDTKNDNIITISDNGTNPGGDIFTISID